jgi:hypothetical protein
MPDPVETAEWIDGPGFVKWFEEQRPDRGFTPPTTTRTFYQARNTGRPINVWAADRILTFYGLHIRDIPRELWLPDYELNTRRRNPEMREECVRRAEAGERTVDLSREFGVAPETINKWRYRMAA